MIHSNLKALLAERNVSGREFARRIDYRLMTVQRFMNNELERYPRELIDRICTELDVGVGELLEYRAAESNEAGESKAE